MNWPLWVVTFVLTASPVGILIIDRIVGYPAPKLFKVVGAPSLIVLAGITIYGVLAREPLCTLIIWGTVGGILGTVALDIVRLIGVRFKLFPMDMPRMFGAIALGLGPKLQRNMIGALVARLAKMPEAQRRRMMTERLSAIAKMPEAQRIMVIGAMRRGLERLAKDQRKLVVGTQVEILSEMPSEARRTIMRTMDEVTIGDGTPGFYGQPRGMPRIPMAMFREMMEEEVYSRTLQEERVSLFHAAFRGYVWHFFIGGISLGIPYTLLVGQGSWGLAIAWGIFVWAVMMIAMPPMMRMIQFPWRVFPIVPFIAHIAFAIPIGYFALRYINAEAMANSLLGALR
ncbi:MAG: hypothetical protein ACE5JP_09135 [Candidatus Bipolaricaulia bacterium]